MIKVAYIEFEKGVSYEEIKAVLDPLTNDGFTLITTNNYKNAFDILDPDKSEIQSENE